MFSSHDLQPSLASGSPFTVYGDRVFDNARSAPTTRRSASHRPNRSSKNGRNPTPHNIFLRNDLQPSLAGENRFAEYGDSVFDTASPPPRIEPPTGPKSNCSAKKWWPDDCSQHVSLKRLAADASKCRPFCHNRCNQFAFDNAHPLPNVATGDGPQLGVPSTSRGPWQPGALLDDR